jgi:hypothetical protein
VTLVNLVIFVAAAVGRLSTQRDASELPNPDVPEFHACAVTEKPDVTLAVHQSRTGLQDFRILYLIEIRIDNRRAVEHDRDVTPANGNLLRVPFTNRLLKSALRWNYAID